MKRIFPLAFPFLLAGCPSIGDRIPVDYPATAGLHEGKVCITVQPQGDEKLAGISIYRLDEAQSRTFKFFDPLRDIAPISASLMRATYLRRGSSTISPRSWPPRRNSRRVSFPLRVNSSPNSLYSRKAINLGWKPSAPHANPTAQTYPKSPHCWRSPSYTTRTISCGCGRECRCPGRRGRRRQSRSACSFRRLRRPPGRCSPVV